VAQRQLMLLGRDGAFLSVGSFDQGANLVTQGDTSENA
jgi:hypothetical protein